MFRCKIETKNDAFQHGDKTMEVIRILKEVISQLERGVDSSTIHDINGGKVGSWNI